MRALAVITVALVLTILVITGFINASHREGVLRAATELTGGNPARGKARMSELGCVACHVVPGIPGTKPSVGPSLETFAARIYVAGVAENTPDNVMQFLQDPRSIAPKSAMPKLKVTAADARDLAAYLYTLH